MANNALAFGVVSCVGIPKSSASHGSLSLCSELASRKQFSENYGQSLRQRWRGSFESTFDARTRQFIAFPVSRKGAIDYFPPCSMNYEVPTGGGRVSQHTLHILVDDEAGILTRIVGLFSRRGYNIDSLAVGLTNKRALITMVVPGDDKSISHLNQQLSKLINVLKVQDVTELPKVERELMLMKVEATAETRTEILEVADIFRARVVEITERSITLEVTGDPGKTAAIQRVLHRHTVRELARTGKIALLRESLVDSNFLRLYGAKSNASQLLFDAKELGPEDEANNNGSSNGRGTAYPAANLAVEFIKSPVKELPRQKLYTIQVLVQDVAGILVRVTSLFSRRGYNIESLAVGNAEKPGLSRITLVVPADAVSIEQVKRQINKLIHVLEVEDITEVPTVQRELMLLKVNADANRRTEILQIAKVYRARVLDVGDDCLTVEVTGDPGKMAAIQQMLRKFGIREIARTGKVALVRESKVNTNVVTAGAWTLEAEAVAVPI